MRFLGARTPKCNFGLPDSRIYFFEIFFLLSGSKLWNSTFVPVLFWNSNLFFISSPLMRAFALRRKSRFFKREDWSFSLNANTLYGFCGKRQLKFRCRITEIRAGAHIRDNTINIISFFSSSSSSFSSSFSSSSVNLQWPWTHDTVKLSRRELISFPEERPNR